ncbi:hypothetical protein [Pseudomonas sp.]|nr:hypothetical protein [Pseudomonas sp.]
MDAYERQSELNAGKNRTGLGSHQSHLKNKNRLFRPRSVSHHPMHFQAQS